MKYVTTQPSGRFESTIIHTCQTRIIQKAELLGEKERKKRREEERKRKRKQEKQKQKQHRENLAAERSHIIINNSS